MGLRLFATRGQHPQSTWRYFVPEQLGAFHRETVLTFLYRDQWTSVLVTDGRQAMLHCFVVSPIRSSSYHDIDAWIGYAGPVFSVPDPHMGFVQDALSHYMSWCRRSDIITEVIRFDPAVSNHEPFRQAEGVQLVHGRPIAYAPCNQCSDEGQQLRYVPACRRRVRMGRSRYQFVHLDKHCAGDRQRFFDLYRASLRRVGALRRWYFDQELPDRVPIAPEIELLGMMANVDNGSRLVSGILSVADRNIAHSLLVANLDPRAFPGAHDYLTHRMIRFYAEAGYKEVCLGGGGRSIPRDSLLRFKLRFCGGLVRPLVVGLLVHNPQARGRLTRLAHSLAAVDPRLQPTDDFLCDLSPYRWAIRFARPES